MCLKSIFLFFNKTKFNNKSCGLPMTSSWNSLSILQSNFQKIKRAVIEILPGSTFKGLQIIYNEFVDFFENFPDFSRFPVF